MKLTRRQTQLIQLLAIPVSAVAVIITSNISAGTYTLFIASQLYYVYCLREPKEK